MFSPYVLILVWIGFVALVTSRVQFQRLETVCGTKEPRYPWLFAFLVFLPVIWMAGNRTYVGDTYMYRTTFLKMPSSFAEIPAYMQGITKDKGFYFFSAVVKQFIGADAVLYTIVLAVIQGIILASVFRKYSYSYTLSVFLFLASADYISWMYNGIRQFTAVVIVFAATSFMLKKKYVPLILAILLASTFHQTALLMIPFVFIAQGKAWNKRTVLFIGLTILAVLFVDQFTTLLDDTLSETQYKNVVSDYTSWNDDGTNPLRVLVYSVPAILAFAGRKQIRSEGNRLINLCTNMSIISMGLYLVSMVTSGIFIGRLPIYCSLYGYILLPWEIEHLIKPRSRGMVYIGMIGAYLLFYYYQMHITYGMF